MIEKLLSIGALVVGLSIVVVSHVLTRFGGRSARVGHSGLVYAYGLLRRRAWPRSTPAPPPWRDPVPLQCSAIIDPGEPEPELGPPPAGDTVKVPVHPRYRET